MSSSAADPVESIIQSFSAELNALTKTWEKWETTFNNNDHSTIQSTPKNKKTRPPIFTSSRPAPYVIKDPPPSAERFSPLRNYVNRSTPTRNHSQKQQNSVVAPPSIRSTKPSIVEPSVAATTLGSVETPAEPPPAPVETPFPASYATPNRFRSTSSTTGAVRIDPRDNTLTKIRQSLDNQETLIKELKEENQMLREQLRNRSKPTEDDFNRERLLFNSVSGSTNLPPHDYQQRNNLNEYRSLKEDLSAARKDTSFRSRRHGNEADLDFQSCPEPSRRSGGATDDDRSEYLYREDFSAAPPSSLHSRRNINESFQTSGRGRINEEPRGRRTSVTSSYRTTPMSTPNRNLKSPPKQIYSIIPEHSNEMMIAEEGFTPGTRFVSKLATLMDMQEGHHAPLSIIMDRHRDQLKAYFDDI
jgi:hypothetical protein